MKQVLSVIALGLLLGGCSSSGVLNSLGMGSPAPAPAANTIQVGNNLAMPPDLQLRPPGTAPAPAAQADVAAAPAQSNALYSASAAPVAKAPVQDIYAANGISKLKPDGTAKTREELQAELKVALLKKKQQQQPGYGTVRNIGNIFSDG
jgi:PBP1b-binding outer membrane lipoprotein LpoB